MKKNIVLILTILFLVGCTSSHTKNVQEDNKTIPKELFDSKKTKSTIEKTTEETIKSDGENTLEEVDGPPLQKVGQWFQSTENQKIELLKINTNSKSETVDGLEIFIKDIKVSKYIYNEMPDNLSDEFIKEFMSDKQELYTLQIAYRIINMTPNSYNYSGLQSYTTNTEKSFDLYLDNILPSSDTSILPNSESELILVQNYITEEDYNNLNYINLDLGSFYNENSNLLQEFPNTIKFDLV